MDAKGEAERGKPQGAMEHCDYVGFLGLRDYARFQRPEATIEIQVQIERISSCIREILS